MGKSVRATGECVQLVSTRYRFAHWKMGSHVRSTHMQVPQVALQPLLQLVSPSVPGQQGEHQLLWIGSRRISQLAWRVAPPQQAQLLLAMLAWPMRCWQQGRGGGSSAAQQASPQPPTAAAPPAVLQGRPPPTFSRCSPRPKLPGAYRSWRQHQGMQRLEWGQRQQTCWQGLLQQSAKLLLQQLRQQVRPLRSCMLTSALQPKL